jgi:hypothetical protein
MQASRSRGDLSLNPLSHAAWQAVTSSKNYVEVPIFESPASTCFTTRAWVSRCSGTGNALR